MNLDNYVITPPHIAFEECVKEAKNINVAAAGSELVGLDSTGSYAYGSRVLHTKGKPLYTR